MIIEFPGLKRLIRSIIYVFVAVFPFVIYDGFLFNGTSSRAFNTVLLIQIILVLLGFSLLKNNKKIKILKSPITIALTLLFLSMLTSSILGVDFNSSFWSKVTRTTGLFYFSHIAFLYFIIQIFFHETKDLNNLLKTFVISTATFSLLSVFGKEGFGLLFVNKPWQGLTIGNSTFAGMYIFSAFIVSLYFIKSNEVKINKFLKYLLPPILFFNPFTFNFNLLKGEGFTGISSLIGSAQASSFSIFFFLAVFAFLLLVERIKSKNIKSRIFIFSVIASLVFLFAGSILLLRPGSFVQEAYLSRSTAARPIVWDLSKKAIEERPVFGWGLDNFDIAYQKYYDNRVLEQDKGGEAWFDRAHNVFIDQLIETGYVGLIAYLALFLAIIYCLSCVYIRSDNSDVRWLSSLLLFYFIFHIIEIQTSFDTTISHVPLIIFIAITATLFNRVVDKKYIDLKNKNGSIIGALFILFAIFMFIFGTTKIFNVQRSNTLIRTVGSSVKRLDLYPNLFSTKMDLPAYLWATSNDIQRGVSLDPSVLQNKPQAEALSREISVIIDYYEDYFRKQDDNLRAILNMADFYIYQRLFGVDNLDKAHNVLDRAIEIVPDTPQPYWMKSVAYLYQAKFSLASEYAQKAYEINPAIEESSRLKDYIEESVKTFPEISLYNFKQI